ncbi:MAG: response regulator [Candidatus Omnitrophica bacterium]|nr:response regulator [Candidatus Omnitrophota bacterium]
MAKNTVLVVDDEEYMVSLLRRALTDESTEVIGACNGLEALDLVVNRHVDLVIADNNMPKLLGEKLLGEVRKLDPFIQLIMITGYPSMDVINKMLEIGISDFVIKPFNLQELQDMVRETLRRVERWRKLRKDWSSNQKPTGPA